MPLPDIITALKNKTLLPDKTIAITFEGAYRSAFTNAMPTLIKQQIPFTVFFASNHADSDVEQHLNWPDLKNLNRHKFISLGLHPASYVRLAGENNTGILEQINKARLRYRNHFKQEPKLFSYPFGEYSLAYRNLIEKQGFTAAFGLNSGTTSGTSDIFALPRFTMTENYGDIERFRLVTHARPFPVHSMEPQDPYLETNAPSIGFSVSPVLTAELDKLSCFVSGQQQPAIERLGENRIELRLAEPLSKERTRINCTLPTRGNKDIPSWRWLGMLLIQGQKNSEETKLGELQ